MVVYHRLYLRRLSLRVLLSSSLLRQIPKSLNPCPFCFVVGCWGSTSFRSWSGLVWFGLDFSPSHPSSLLPRFVNPLFHFFFFSYCGGGGIGGMNICLNMYIPIFLSISHFVSSFSFSVIFFRFCLFVCFFGIKFMSICFFGQFPSSKHPGKKVLSSSLFTLLSILRLASLRQNHCHSRSRSSRPVQ